VKRIIAVLLVILAVATLSIADETSFSRVAAPDSKGRLTKAVLTFSDDHKAIEVQPVKGTPVSIPYAEIDKFSYEYTKKHRITQGAVVMVASLGVGAIVMMTKSKSHWFYIDFHEQNVPKSVVLRMDKKEYKKIFEGVKTHTGKEVEFLGDARNKKKG